MKDQELFSGLIRLHILRHAAREPICGLSMSSRLRNDYDYQLTPGRLYMIMRGLESRGYLAALEDQGGKSPRKLYRITTEGRRVLAEARLKVKELSEELSGTESISEISIER